MVPHHVTNTNDMVTVSLDTTDLMRGAEVEAEAVIVAEIAGVLHVYLYLEEQHFKSCLQSVEVSRTS